MLRKTKKFDWYKARQRFSIRTYHFGAASVLLGMSLVAGAQSVSATEVLSETMPSNTVVAETGTEEASSQSDQSIVTVESAGSVVSEEVAADTIAPVTPVILTDLTGKAGQAVAVIVSAEAGSNVALYDANGQLLGNGTADASGQAIIILTLGQTETSLTALATDQAGNVSEASETVQVTALAARAEASTVVVPVVETVETTTPAPTAVDAARKVLEQVTSEAAVLASEGERLVATTETTNTALQTAVEDVRVVAVQSEQVLTDSLATLEQLTAQIDAVRSRVEVLAVELRKFSPDGLITAKLDASVPENPTNIMADSKGIKSVTSQYIGKDSEGLDMIKWTITHDSKPGNHWQFILIATSDKFNNTSTSDINVTNGSTYNGSAALRIYDSQERFGYINYSPLASYFGTENGSGYYTNEKPGPGAGANRAILWDNSWRDESQSDYVIEVITHGPNHTLYVRSASARGTQVAAENLLREPSATSNADWDDTFKALPADQQTGANKIVDENGFLVAPTPTPTAEKTDQYNITWDNKSVAGRSDSGFEWATDASGNRVLIYKYNLDNTTAFTMDDVLKQLNAEPKDAASGLRTLDGTEKALIENTDASDGYTTEGSTAKLNGQTIDFLDVVTPVKLWGGRPVVSNTEGTTEDYTTFYVPGTTDIGTATNSVTVGGTNGVGEITVTDNAFHLYSNQVDRQKLYIRSSAASYQYGSGSAIATDTDTDTIPVYMVGYKEATDQYNITWDNQSVAGRTDAGFEWAQDANGNKVLIYKYDLDNHTAFNMDDVLKQLNATPKDTASGLRTLDGTDKSNIENNLENFSRSGKVATLNGQPTDFLDVVTPVKLWGGRPVVSNTEGTTEDYTTFYVPNTTDIGTATNSVTVGGTNGVGTITVTDTERELYTNQVDRQKLYIRKTDASNEAGSDSAVATDTDTDTIPVYMIGYKANKPTTATNPKPLYIFKDTAIKTVDPGSNADTITTDDYVNVVTLQDPEGIKTVSVSRESDVGTAVFNPASIGITIDAAGNATGTTDKPAGVYSRGLTVTDNKDDVTNLFPRNNELVNYVFDATAGETITKAVGESVTEAEILDNVTINTGDSSNFDAAIDSRYRKVLAPGQTLPTTPGTHYVTVRVITDSNVYKDVVVEVEIPENPPTTATDKQTIYVFNNTPIQTVDPATKEPNKVNKVKVATLTDPQG
ncbi:YSIRK-type signal peptide-containing protein, partial [Streptococcus suis]|nr:YSIRK-type signal peptide-containing protein [Streptococcus suis]